MYIHYKISIFLLYFLSLAKTALELVMLNNWILSIVGMIEWKDVYPLYVVLYGGCPPASITATLALV